MTTVTISSGHTSSGTYTNETIVVQAGGTLISAILNGGTVTDVYGLESATILRGVNATETVFAGGSAVSTTLAAKGATMVVDSGGTAISTIVSSAAELTDSGVARGTIVSGGGIMTVGGVAIGTVASNGAQIIVLGVASGTIVRGAAASLDVYGTTISTVVSSGAENVYMGAVASDTVVRNGGFQSVSGTSISTTLLGGGDEFVNSGGVASGTVLSGGNQYVYSGGAAIGTVISNGGSEFVYPGGTTISTTVLGGGSEFVYSGGIASSTVVSSGGYEVVSAGGSVSGTVISNGGSELVYPGGTTTSTTVLSGGAEYVYTDGITISTTVLGGGTEYVYTGGIASSTVVSSGGYEVVSAGGQATGTIVSSGGFEVVSAGGSATLTSVASGGVIDVVSLTFVSGGSAMFNSATDLLTVRIGTQTYTQTLQGNYAGYSFKLSQDTNFGGTDITLEAPCYCRGTRILTARGDIAVEDLRAGDLAVTGLGGGLRPILWIGHTPFDATRHPHPNEVFPIRVRAGAFGDGLPKRDLLVSPGHSFLFDGALIQIQNLINGGTIAQDRSIARGEYWHVELQTHDILLAEGAPAESYLDTGNRKAFAGASIFHELYPDFSPKPWTDTCVPLVTSGPAIAAARQRLLATAQALCPPVKNPDLHVILPCGTRIDPHTIQRGRHVFHLPAPAPARLASRIWIPAQQLPDSRDRRQLGARVARIALDGRYLRLTDDGLLTQGWHKAESSGRTTWRWTNGAAQLHRPARTIEIDLIPDGIYWPPTAHPPKTTNTAKTYG